MGLPWRWVCLVLLGGVSAAAGAQEPACGVSTFTETTAPVYPPIAKAAHVSGDVLLLLTIERDGTVSDAQALRGPEMLKKTSINFVKGWKANAYGGSRSCPVVVRYAISGTMGCGDDWPGQPATEETRRVDSQHYSIVTESWNTCDLASTITRRKKFLGIF